MAEEVVSRWAKHLENSRGNWPTITDATRGRVVVWLEKTAGHFWVKLADGTQWHHYEAAEGDWRIKPWDGVLPFTPLRK